MDLMLNGTTFPPVLTTETTDTTASLPKLRPLKVLKVVSGRKLRLRCRGTGKPSMLFTWYKDGVPLELRPGLTMRSTRKSSRLQIRHTKPEDAGVYKCSAANAMGVVDVQTSVTVEAGTGPKKPRTTTSTHYTECSKRMSNYCMHGGTCLYTPDIKGAEPFCRCTDDYYGKRCQVRVMPTVDVPIAPPNIQRKDWDRGMTLAGIIIGVIVLIAIFIAAFVMSKKRRKEAREKRLRKQQQRASENANSATYRPVSEGTVALNLAAPPPPSPKVRTASMTTQTDPVKISTPEAPHRNSGFPQIKRDSSSFSKLNGHRSPTPTEDSPKRIRLQGVSSSSSSSSSPEKTSPERQIVPVTVESDLEKHASSSQNSKTESIQGAPSDPIPINNGHVRPKSQNSNGYSKSSNGRVEADQLSDYENQNSDYEPEIDLKGLDLAMTPDLVGIARRCQSKSNSVASCNESSDNESSSSSSAGVSEGLLEHDRIHSLKNNEHTSDQDSAGNLSWDEYGNMTTPTGFGNPYALEDDIIDNSYLNHNASNRSPQHSKLDKDSWHLKDRLLDVKEDADPVAI